MITSKEEVLNKFESQPDGFHDVLDEMSEELYRDKDIILKALDLEHKVFGEYSDTDFMDKVPIEIRNDKDFIMEAIFHNTWALCHASDRLREDKEIARAMLSACLELDSNYEGLLGVSPKLLDDREFIMKEVYESGWPIQCISERLLDDKEVVLKALLGDPGIASYNYSYASPRLQKDVDVQVVTLLSLDKMVEDIVFDDKIVDFANTIDYLKLEQKDGIYVSKKDIMMNVVKYNGDFLDLAIDELKNDRELVLEALKQTSQFYRNAIPKHRYLSSGPIYKYPTAMKFASDALKTDSEFALDAIKIDFEAYEFISDELKSKESFKPEKLLELNPFMLKYCSFDFKNNKKLVTDLIVKDELVLQFASDELRNDKELLLKAIKEIQGDALCFASDTLKDDDEVVKAAVLTGGMNIDYASDRLKDDKDMMLLAVQYDSSAAVYASDRLKKDKNFAKKVVVMNDITLQFIDDKLKNDKQFLIEALSDTSGIANGQVLFDLNYDFSDDKDLAMVIVRRHGAEFEDLSDELRDDKEVAVAAIKNDYPLAFEYVSDRLKDDKELLTFALIENEVLDLEQANEILSCASERLQNDKDILEIMKKFK